MAETDRPHGEQGRPPAASGRDAQDHQDLTRLGQQLEAAQARQDGGPASDPAAADQQRAMGKAYSLAIEMVAAVGVSVFIGWWVDRWFGSKPWGILGFALLGIAAAMWSAIRTGMMMQARQQADEARAAQKDKGD